ncbi:hypothetical protein ACP70R_031659 [Stipagrostis hirtigluma subsp. patula]
MTPRAHSQVLTWMPRADDFGKQHHVRNSRSQGPGSCRRRKLPGPWRSRGGHEGRRSGMGTGTVQAFKGYLRKNGLLTCVVTWAVPVSTCEWVQDVRHYKKGRPPPKTSPLSLFDLLMERAYQKFALLGILIHAAIITGGCFPSNQKQFKQGNRTAPWASKFHPQFYGSNGEKISSEDPAAFIYASSHVVFPGNGTSYYGVEATIDVYGLTLESDQLSQAGVWIVNRGDGQPTSFYGFQAGWQIWPAVYKDSHTHFFTSWISGGPDKDCLNMNCPGFQKTSSNIVPGDVISPVSDTNGSKQCITIRLFKDKPTGDWHVHYGFNGAPKPVGYVPKSLLPGMIDKQVEINFGGLAFHRKPQPSPPMEMVLFQRAVMLHHSVASC